MNTEDNSLNHEMKRGLFWTAMDKYSGQIIAIFISMILARLLTPYEFGVVATASVFLGFLQIFTSVGIGPAVIQRRDLSQVDLNNIFTFTVVLGFAMGLISFFSAWIIADFYENKLLIPVICILSIGLFLGTINMVPSALMSKNKRFKEMATRSLSFQVIFGFIGLISAYFGAGVYALILPQILSSLCTFFYNNHFYPVRICWRFSMEPIKRIFSYSAFVFLFEFFNYFSRNLDKIIIGKYISANALGYYEKSYRLMQMPLQNVSSVINPVLQPILSTLQDNMDEMASKFTKIVSAIATISFPIAVILYFIAYEIIVVMFGQTWLPAVPTFEILAWAIPLMLICNPTGAIFMSCNASKQMFYVGVSNSTVTVIGFIIAATYYGTIEAIAYSWTITIFFNTINAYYWLYIKVMRNNIFTVIRVLAKPALCTIILFIFYIIYERIMVFEMQPIFALALKMLYGVVITFIYLGLSKQFNIIVFLKEYKQRYESRIRT